MNKKHTLMNLFIFVFITPLWGMENNKSENKEIVTFLSNTDKTDFPYIIRDIYDDTTFTNYASGQFVSNQKTIIESRNNAHARGAKVCLALGNHSQNNPSEHHVTTLLRTPFIHAKLTAALDCSPSKKTPTQSIVLLGSNNESDATWSNDLNKPNIRHNLESAILIKNNIELATAAYNEIQSTSPMKPEHEKIVISNTPEKTSFYSSKKVKLNESWAQRLHSLAKDSSDNRVARLETMNVNDDSIIDASIAAKKSGANIEWHVNHTALTENGVPLLKKLDKANIPVYVFDPCEGSHATKHDKTITIIKGKKSNTIFSNGNFTDKGDTQPNCAIEVPNNEEITQDSLANFERNKTRSKLFIEALQSKEEKNNKKVEKRELEKLEAKKSTTKKQKTKK